MAEAQPPTLLYLELLETTSAWIILTTSLREDQLYQSKTRGPLVSFCFRLHHVVCLQTAEGILPVCLLHLIVLELCVCVVCKRGPLFTLLLKAKIVSRDATLIPVSRQYASPERKIYHSMPPSYSLCSPAACIVTTHPTYEDVSQPVMSSFTSAVVWRGLIAVISSFNQFDAISQHRHPWVNPSSTY